jgi:hypothetical protein
VGANSDGVLPVGRFRCRELAFDNLYDFYCGCGAKLLPLEQHNVATDHPLPLAQYHLSRFNVSSTLLADVRFPRIRMTGKGRDDPFAFSQRRRSSELSTFSSMDMDSVRRRRLFLRLLTLCLSQNAVL